MKEAAGGAVVPVDGYPVRVLQDAWRGRGGDVHMDGDGVMVLTSRDRLTGRTNVIRLEVQPGAADYRSTQCGPASVVITRMAADGQVYADMGMQDVVFTVIEGAAGQLGLPHPEQLPTQASQPVNPVRSLPPAAPPASSPTTAPPVPVAAPATPASEESLTAEYQTCMASEDARNQLPAALKECTNGELRRHDDALNAVYRTTITRLAPEAQQQFRVQERAWIAEGVAVCRKRANADGAFWDDLAYAQCQLGRTGERTAWLASYR